MTDLAPINVVEMSVSELSVALKRSVEDAFGYVRVRGELGNVKYHSNGHVYLDLKDERACLAGVIWKSATPRIKVKLETGLEVVVTGRITTYPAQSKYQIVIESVEPAGLGALMALLEERKRRLAEEGLFDAAKKQPLPFLPEVIGVITSPSGAVIRDILHRLSDRFPRRVMVWPVRVQGEGSAEQVAAAISGLNGLPKLGVMPRPDLLIVARGGGSLEDLWSFNEEIVVRAAAASLIPLISAVGHETDVTLIDFAADQRAPTPTAAAEMAVPVRADLILIVQNLGRRGFGALRRALEAWRTQMRACIRGWPTAEGLLAVPRQRVDVASERLPRALRANAQLHLTQFCRTGARLGPQILQVRVVRDRERVAAAGERALRAARVVRERQRHRLEAAIARFQAGRRANVEAYGNRIRRDFERVAALGDRSQRAAAGLIGRHRAALERTAGLLTAYSYRGVLERGFALVRGRGGIPLRSAAAVSPGARLDIEFSDGRVAAVADATRPVDPEVSRGGRGPARTEQGNLFADTWGVRRDPERP